MVQVSEPIPGSGFGYRHVQYVLLFCCSVVAYGSRTILNVAIVEMIPEDSVVKDYPTYPEWKDHKNTVLSSFFWGYICLQVGAGQLAKNYGPKLFLGGAIFIGSLFSILIPVFGKQFGYIGVIVCRIIQGMTQGFMLPSTHNLLSSWAPLSERAKWGGIVYNGMALGNVIAMPLTGAICSTNAGWPVVFYLYGSLGMIWCTLWFIFAADKPAKHKNISKEEREFIENNLDSKDDYSKIPTPWKSIFTSVPFITLIITHCAQNWGFWTLLTEIPSFLKNIMGLNIATNSSLSALPYLMMFLLGFVMSPIADMLIRKNIVSVTTSRKIFNTIGFAVPALALISLIFVEAGNKVATIVILVIAVGFNAGQLSGFNLNHIDLSPVHSGTLMAITNSTGAIASILAPLAVDLFRKISGYEETDKQLWNIVFGTAGGVFLFGAVIFDLFATANLQKWNASSRKSAEENIPDKVRLEILRKISTTLSYT
ncbi:putative inorganic phosphate cotransporter [Leptinotarsa decemlineata]|uniref:putative inorganic phosphate cotransporter n=1 Tax=Leptinotarsa decemlineata TaxID=7539 RepID=UPI003D305E48